MERLTKRNFVFNSHYVANKLQSWSIAQCLKKLQKYENAEEDERLLILPCKVGDTVWIVGDKFPAEIEEIRITDDGIFFVYVEYDRGYELTEVWDNYEFQVADIGKTVFLTHAEAEAALAERANGND